MALKDSVLQQGFEIICKENKELEEKISFYYPVKTALKIKAVGFVLRNMKINASHKKFSTLKNYSKKMQN